MEHSFARFYSYLPTDDDHSLSSCKVITFTIHTCQFDVKGRNTKMSSQFLLVFYFLNLNMVFS